MRGICKKRPVYIDKAGEGADLPEVASVVHWFHAFIWDYKGIVDKARSETHGACSAWPNETFMTGSKLIIIFSFYLKTISVSWMMACGVEVKNLATYMYVRSGSFYIRLGVTMRNIQKTDWTLQMLAISSANLLTIVYDSILPKI